MTVTVYDVKHGDYVLVNEEGYRTPMRSKQNVLRDDGMVSRLDFSGLKDLSITAVPKEFT